MFEIDRERGRMIECVWCVPCVLRQRERERDRKRERKREKEGERK